MSTSASIEAANNARTHHYYQHTTTAVVISPAAGQQQPQNIAAIYESAHHPQPRNRSSFSAVSAQSCQHSLLTPSSSTSSSTSVVSVGPASSSVSASIHHSHLQNQHRKSSASLTSKGDMVGVAAVMDEPCSSNNKRNHADVSVCCSSSSSCCSSSSANSATASQSLNHPNAPITNKISRTIPSEKINLRLILVSGKTKEFLFNPSDSAGDIAQTVFENWPEDWEREAVSKAEILRLIYQGRFLHCNVTLGALGLPLGKTTVMHLVPRDNLPEPNSQDQRQKSKGGSSRCCSATCCIL